MNAFLDFNPLKNCINHNTYGEICVQCNCCGRFGEEGKIEAQKRYWKECLDDAINFDRWFDEPELRAHQEKVRQQNIEYYNEKLAELEK